MSYREDELCRQERRFTTLQKAKATQSSEEQKNIWPTRPETFPDLMTPIEAAVFLRLDQTGHTPASAKRTLNYWRDTGELKATKFARRVWYLRQEVEAFLKNRTETG